MKKQQVVMIAGSAVLAGILATSFYGIGQSFASSGESDSHRFYQGKQNPVYLEECGSCHMAYPPQLLPGKSWQKMLQGLEDHFGENAEVDLATSSAIASYLQEASRSNSYKKMFRNLGNRSPLRITELPYFKHEHDEIPSRFIADNDKLSSLSQCDACHQDAQRGQFDEDDVIIPGVGHWDD
ncbi:MAG: hypothetical protein GY784_02430 [Gammaproteobacteria bacterium]|nr:hypothetical protein [Gammaproteobacteria bacterium]